MDFQIAEKLNPYPKRTLFIGGALSDYITTQEQDQMQRWFPKYRLVMIKNSGHWLHVDQPKVFENTIRIFLRS